MPLRLRPRRVAGTGTGTAVLVAAALLSGCTTGDRAPFGTRLSGSSRRYAVATLLPNTYSPPSTPANASPLASYAAAATVCSLLHPDEIAQLAPAGIQQPTDVFGLPDCTIIDSDRSTMTVLSIEMTPTARSVSLLSTFEMESRDPSTRVTWLRSLGHEAVSMYRPPTNGSSRSEVLWRQDGYQLELTLTTPGGSDRRKDLVDIATRIYWGHPH